MAGLASMDLWRSWQRDMRTERGVLALHYSRIYRKLCCRKGWSAWPWFRDVRTGGLHPVSLQTAYCAFFWKGAVLDRIYGVRVPFIFCGQHHMRRPGLLGDGQHQCHDSDAEYFGIRQISYRDLRKEIADIFDLRGTLWVCRLLSRRVSSWNGAKPDLLVWPCGRRSAGSNSGGAVLEICAGAVSERRGMIYPGRRDYFFTTGIHTSYRAF